MVVQQLPLFQSKRTIPRKHYCRVWERSGVVALQRTLIVKIDRVEIEADMIQKDPVSTESYFSLEITVQ